MPGFRGQQYAPAQGLPAGASKDDDVFVLRVTGEVVASYGDYVAKLRQYRSREWTCAYTGKSGLTYEEAVQSEARSATLLSKVSPDQPTAALLYYTIRICMWAFRQVARCMAWLATTSARQ